MKKEEQRKVNIIVENYYTAIVDVLNHQVCRVWEKLYSCKARVYYVNNARVLVSYDTKVAVYDPSEKTVYDYSRKVYGYTATTAQHVAKFAKFCNAEKIMVYRDV